MKKIKFLIILFITFFNWGCVCEKCFPPENSISFDFKIGTASDCFTLEEVDTIIVYKLTKNTNTIIDSGFIADKPFILNEFGFNFGGKEDQYWLSDYLVKTQSAKKIKITDLVIEVMDEGRGSCKCIVNKTKKLKVDGVLIDLSGNGLNINHVQLKK